MYAFAHVGEMLNSRYDSHSRLQSSLISDGQSVWYGDSAVSQVQDNGYPIYQENFVPQQIGQAQFIWDQSQEGTNHRFAFFFI